MVRVRVRKRGQSKRKGRSKSENGNDLPPVTILFFFLNNERYYILHKAALENSSKRKWALHRSSLLLARNTACRKNREYLKLSNMSLSMIFMPCGQCGDFVRKRDYREW